MGFAVSVSVIVIILGFKYVTTVIPGALIAVIGSIIALPDLHGAHRGTVIYEDEIPSSES